MRSSVVIAYAGFVLMGVSVGVGGVLLPAQITDYGVDKATIGLTFFTFSAGFLLAGTTTGAVMERLGARHSLVLGCAAFALAAIATGLRPPFVLLLAVQAVAGYGTGLIESVMNVYLAALPKAAPLLNRLHAFFGLGALLGPPLAAWTLTFAPWTMVWTILGGAVVLLGVGVVFAYPRAPHVREQAPGGGLLWTTVRVRVVVLASLFLMVYVGLEIGVGNWGYSYLVEERAQSALLAGYSVSGYWLGLTLGRFLISPLALRLGIGTADMASLCLLGVVGATALTWATPLPSVGLALLGFFLGPLFPTTMAVLPDLVEPRLAATAIGVVNGVSVVGGSALPWLAGAIAHNSGIWTLMPFALTLAVVQFWVWRLLVRR